MPRGSDVGRSLLNPWKPLLLERVADPLGRYFPIDDGRCPPPGGGQSLVPPRPRLPYCLSVCGWMGKGSPATWSIRASCLRKPAAVIGKGHYGWDLTPESTMTNATVYTAEAATDGRALTLRYPEGEKTVVMLPQAPVVSLESGNARLLRSGGHVFVLSAARRPDGTLSANVVAIGQDGLGHLCDEAEPVRTGEVEGER